MVKAQDTRQKTAVNSSAFKAALPNAVQTYINRYSPRTVLDFGAGPYRRYTKQLARDNPATQIDGYDLGDTYPTAGAYDLIFLSNVINVQRIEDELQALFQELWDLAGPHTYILINYPKEPRKLGLNIQDMRERLLSFGWIVTRHHDLSNTSTVIWGLEKNKDRF